MAIGDFEHDGELQEAWRHFCDNLKEAGDLVFKDYNPANSLQRADGFRFLTQNLSQAFDLALETRNSRFPQAHHFCGPNRKLGGDNADFIYLQAWIDGQSAYKITGNKGSARFMNFTVQGPRPETDTYYGSDTRNLHEPFGDTPEANIFGHELKAEWDGSFELYIGGEQQGANWLPTTPGSRKLFLRQGFDRWDEDSAEFRIERIDMNEPRPAPDHVEVLDAIQWVSDAFILPMMQDWPDLPLQYKGGRTDELNVFPGEEGAPEGSAEERDARRGRLLVNMHWKLAEDEAIVVEFPNHDGFWMLTNMGTFMNSMDYLYRPVSYTPSRATVDGDDRVRLIMSHADLGYHNWIDTQGFEEGYLTHRNVMARFSPPLSTQTVKVGDLPNVLPQDTRMVTPEERAHQLHERFNGIRRRYRL